MKTRLTITILLLMLTIAATTLCLTACSENSDNEEPVSPTPQVPTGDWQTVPASGGTIEKGDISITFPSGTFTAETKVAVTEVKKGDIRGDDEVSPFYQVTMPAVTRQKMTVSIKSDATDDDIIMVAHGLASSLSGETCYVDMPLDATHRNGVYTAELPVFDNNADASYMGTITFGLTHAASAPTTAKAHSTETRSKDNGTFVFNFDWGNRGVAMENKELQDEMEVYLYEAVRLINGLGIKVQEDRKVPIIIEKDKAHGGSHLNDGEFGRYVIGQWSRKHGYILINDGFRTQEEPKKYDKETLRKTIIHELFHYFQTDYDPRDDFWKGGYILGDMNSDYLMLYESGGVWIEKLMADGGNFSTTFIITIDRSPTVMRGLCNVVNGNSQSLGYGQAIFLEYMTKQKGNEAVRILLETWKENKGKEALDVYKAWAKAIDVDIFTPSVGMDEFYKFLVDASTREVTTGFSFANIIPLSQTPEFNDDRKNVNADGTVNYQGKVYPYGGRFTIFGLTKYRNENGENSFKGKQLTFTETQKGVRTYVFYRTQDGFIQLGKFWESEPLIISDEALLLSLNSTTNTIKYPLYMLTYSDDNAKTYSSEISVTLGAPQPSLNVDRTELSFTANGGEEQIVVTTNCTNVRVTQKPNWCSASISGNTLTVNAEKNTTTEKRDGSLIIMAGNSVGDVPAEVKVTQEGKKSGLSCLYDRCLVSFDIPLGETSSCSFACPTPPQNGTSVVNLNTIVYTSSGSIGDDDKRETWDYNFIIDYETNTITEGRVHYHQVFNMWWGWTYDDPPRHKLATSIVYDVSFNVINLPLYRPNARWDSSNYLDLEDVWMHGYGGSKYYGSGELNQYITNFSYSCITEDYMGSAGTKTSTWGTDDIDPNRDWILNIMLEPILP